MAGRRSPGRETRPPPSRAAARTPDRAHALGPRGSQRTAATARRDEEGEGEGGGAPSPSTPAPPTPPRVKDTIIVELGEKLKEYPHFYLVDLTGLNAEKTVDLRRKCFKNEIKLLVVKNKLLHKAFEASEIDFTPLYECLKGNTAVMFTQSANVPAKLIKEYKKEGIPALKGAYAEESFFVGADKLDELVAIKSKNELIAEVVALLQSPIKNVVSGLNAGGKVHGLLDAIAERNK